VDIDVREIRRKDGQLTGRVIRYGSWLVVATDLEIYMRYGGASTGWGSRVLGLMTGLQTEDRSVG
jgi:hypothetical protein